MRLKNSATWQSRGGSQSSDDVNLLRLREEPDCLLNEDEDR